MDERQLDNLCDFIDSQNPVNAQLAKKKTLIKLTLNWIRLTSNEGFMPLIDALGRNRKLRHVNIAWNNLLLGKVVKPLIRDQPELPEEAKTAG